ncbi:MAG: hypothetical protein KIS92_14060 [Planctomycetota bacterium]|nr:hypothetical protein [Planctomycetota bacterium]
MKIGPLDIGISTLVYLALVVVVALADYQLYAAKTAQRTEGRLESGIRASMNEGTEESYKRGAEMCRTIVAQSPQSAPAHLYLATFQFRLGQYKEAQQTFENAAKLSGIAPADASMAYTGAGVAAFAQVPEGERSKGAAGPAEFFKKALEADKESADAKACLGIMTLWKGGLSAPTDALAHFNEALAAKRPAARFILSRAYNARGVALSRLGRAKEADESFQAGTSVDPAWKQVQDNRTLTLISSLGLPGMDVETRVALLERYKNDVQAFKPYEYAARNSMAMGYWITRKDVMTKVYVENNLPQAERLLASAISDRPTEAIAYKNLAGLYQDRLYGDPGEGGRDGLLAKLPPNFFRPSMTPPNLWKDGAASDQPKAEQALVEEIRKTATQEYEVWLRMLGKAKLDPAQQVEANLHLFGVQYVLAALASGTDQANRLNDLRKLGENLLTAAEDHPAALRAQGTLLLRMGDYKKGREYLEKARQKGDGSEELQKVLEALAREPQVYDVRPKRGVNYGKGRPLFGASIVAESCPGGVDATLNVDGKKMDAALSGSQILAIPYDTQLTDGEHKIEIAIEDACGNKARAAASYFIDKRAPTMKLEPEGDVDGPRPVLTIVLDDVGVGIDPGSVKVEFNSLGGGATPCKDILVSEGVYQKEIATVGAKQGDAIPANTFKIAPIRDLTAGMYQVRVLFADKAGNAKTELKPVKVK